MNDGTFFNRDRPQFWTRLQMVAEACEFRVWSPKVADTISQDLKSRPLVAGERLIMIGSSGGGTVAIESLDLLQEKGVFVDQIILRGSLAHELFLRNVRRVDYITSKFDYYYSFDANPFDDIDVHEHKLDFWGHVPPSDNIRKQIGDLIVKLIIEGEHR